MKKTKKEKELKEIVVRFPSDDNDENIENWSSISVSDLIIEGNYRKSKHDMKQLHEWVEKYQHEIVEINEGRLDFHIFKAFLGILNVESHIDNYSILEKSWTKLPIDIMIDVHKGYTITKTPLVVVCLDDKRDYIGVVGVSNPKDAVFVDKKYSYLRQELTIWIEKYRDALKKVAYKKIDLDEFKNYISDAKK